MDFLYVHHSQALPVARFNPSMRPRPAVLAFSGVGDAPAMVPCDTTSIRS